VKDAGIVVLLSGFPRRSETFALHEMLALEERGALAAIFATKAGDGLPLHPESERLLARVQFLPSGTPHEQAEALVQRLRGQKIAGIHAYFAHLPAEVAEEAARRLNVPFGFSVHALDARKVAPAELARRARAASCVIACNSDVATHFDRSDVALQILPHGVDTERFCPRPVSSPPPINLLAVGRLVEKKGFDILIQAAAQLSFPFQLRIVGDGSLRELLVSAIQERGLSDFVEVCPSVTHAQLPAIYAASHVVVVPSIVDQNGDRDGLPNVVLEAMASGRPVIASEVAAIGSVIVTKESGLLVPPGDAGRLAEAIERLALNPAQRDRLAQKARAEVEEHFDLHRCTDRFCSSLQSAYSL